MSDMKVRIVIEDDEGRTKTATLSFDEGAAQKPLRKPAKPPLIRRMIGMGFLIRETVPLLGPGMIGELHVEHVDRSRERCPDCGEPIWVMMEVVEDDEPFASEHPFVEVDHDLIGEFCFTCGWMNLNEGMIGRGVFGLLENDDFLTLDDFLNAISEDESDVLVRTRLFRVLIRQERLHMKAVYRIRQQLAQRRVSRGDAEVATLRGGVKEEEEKAP